MFCSSKIKEELKRLLKENKEVKSKINELENEIDKLLKEKKEFEYKLKKYNLNEDIADHTNLLALNAAIRQQ